MKRIPFQGRTLALLVVLLPLSALFIYVALRSGPLAPVPVTIAAVEDRSIAPALFGIGTVESRYTYKIGPTVAGRIKRLTVQVNESVVAGQILGEMDPVDLSNKIQAQAAAVQRAEAQLVESQARQVFAKSQAQRYNQLLEARSTSEEIVAGKKQEYLIAEANLKAARQEKIRLHAEGAALEAQLSNLNLVAPAAGLVTARNADPGTTVAAGQAVVELIDPENLWINVRFDQIHARGLAAELPAQIVLRTQAGVLTGRVLRTEPLADAVTEEMLAKVVFDLVPRPLPPIGELAEVTVALAPLPSGPAIPNAAIQRLGGKTGVWQIIDEHPHFTPVTLGTAGLEGYVQVTDGLKINDEIVVYSAKALTARSSLDVVEHIPGVAL
ncbi:efflux RND transporter periplasmic adaptor subunit [Desulforhopalus sp. IMCC35007]|uniref:efflux RND transporter periplasmic adaptor subunit n=1 Tax=Desulforhopalus sp. IMCC35007 TaxID=2569543 RepID=UPI0010AE84A5|nr:efflux RND transporter periplasmic adaptor subunit [Desulforhopalus sp. IMCC35007]TKB09730.1 efflux RND transporter periplasmic adaptor subunit [Desulforhopalus sp. IMCC35007]